MIRYTVMGATAADLPAMAAIWESCFGDTPSYIQFFMQNRLPTCHAYIAKTAGETVGALYLLPAQMRNGKIFRRAYYVYALGVLPAYRRCGIASAMMRHVFDICREQDAVCFLKPATPTLVEFYKKLGMQKTHFAKEIRYPAATLENALPWHTLSPQEYAVRRLAHPTPPGGILWDASAVQYAVEENRLCGGFCFSYDTFAGRVSILGRQKGDRLLIEDCIAEAPAAALSALCVHLNTQEAVMRVPASSSDPAAFLLAMTYNMHIPQSGPLGLLLD